MRRCTSRDFGREENCSDRQTQLRFTTTSVAAILECQSAAVSFSDLAAEDETDARTSLLCREEGNEEICRIRNAGAVVEHRDFQIRTVPNPSYLYSAARLVRRV